jgi:programmed cell death 8 (apoptosis-inducing factor)
MLLLMQVSDYWRLQKVISEAKSVAIVGGGFLGSELACCLGKKG